MLKEEVRQAFNNARKTGDLLTKSALEAVIAGILQKEKQEAGKTVNDAEVVDCVAKEVKIQREIAEMFQGKDADKAKEADDKILALEKFLPKQLTEDAVLALIREKDIYADASPKTKGMIIKEIMPLLAGKFDKSKVNGLVEQHLSAKA